MIPLPGETNPPAPASPFQLWIDRKLAIAHRLMQGELDGSYYDGTGVTPTGRERGGAIRAGRPRFEAP